MVSEIEKYDITEPWNLSEDDVCSYLTARNILFTMRGVGIIRGPGIQDSFIVYTAKISSVDVLALKLVFPYVKIVRHHLPNVVSTVATEE